MADKNVLLKDSANNTLYPQIADKSVTTNKLADKSVTKEKLADDINAASVVNTTWYELKKLRDGKKLVPGMQYRITDYKCTTTQEDTLSAGHQFDIIVTADSENTLNEVARAAKHEGDTYFANCNLAAWKIWYSFDNNKNRFGWANNNANIAKVTSGSATYYLYNIAAPANFQNDDSAHKAYAFFKNYNLNDNTLYALIYSRGGQLFNKVEIDSQGYITVKDNLGNYSLGTKEELLAAYPNAVVSEYGHGVIYRMIDEWHNDCPYDFKNIQMEDSDSNYVYTFNNDSLSDTHDITVSSKHENDIDYCTENIINSTSDDLFRSTGDINLLIPFIFFTTGCCCNHINYGSHNVIFKDYCCGNHTIYGANNILFDEHTTNMFVFASGSSDNLLNVSSYSDGNKKFIGLDADGNIRGTAIPKEIDLSAYAKTLSAKVFEGLSDSFISGNTLATTAKDDKWCWLAGFDIEDGIAYIAYNRGYLAIVSMPTGEVLGFIKLASYDSNASEIHNGANCLTAIKIDDNNTYLYISAVRYAEKKCYVEKLTKTTGSDGKVSYSSTLVSTITYIGSKFHAQSGVDFVVDKVAKTLNLIGASASVNTFNAYTSPKTFLQYDLPDVTSSATIELTDASIKVEFTGAETAGATQQGSCVHRNIMYYLGSEKVVTIGEHQKTDLIVYNISDRRIIRTIKVDNFIPNLQERSECEGISVVDDNNGDCDIYVSYHAYGSYGENPLGCKIYKLPFKTSEIFHGGAAFYVSAEDVNREMNKKLADYVTTANVNSALGRKLDADTYNREKVKVVSTTESDYTALSTKDSNTLYCIPEE